MNNEQRENLEELKQADETLRVLDGQQCESDQDSRTLELGRLLKQSASHVLPESNEELREMLLAELEGEAVSEAAMPAVGSKTLAPKKPVDRIGRRRLWLGLPAAGLLIAIGGSWLYSNGTAMIAQHDSATELAELTARAEAAEQQAYEIVSKNVKTPEFALDLDGDGVAHFAKEMNSAVVSKGDVLGESQKQIDLGRLDAVERSNLTFSVYDKETVDFSKKKDKVPARWEESGQQQQGEQASGEGKTITLPRLSKTTKSKVVSVPDGGKVLIGGIEREHNERLDFGLQQGEGQAGQPQQGQGAGSQSSQKYEPSEVEYTPQLSVVDGYFEGGQGGGLGGGILGGGRVKLHTPPNGYSIHEKYARQPTFETDGFATFSDYSRADLDDVYKESKTEQLRGRVSKTREQYAPIYENQFVNAIGKAAVSTFSIDVDTASYANMRRFLNSGQTPPRDSIRIEELVNYFQYDYPQPKGEDPFSVNMELATCPWNDTHKLLRVGLKGKEVHVQERPATNVVYLIDVSGSMSSQDKLPLLKRGFQMMTKQLGENDRVSIVTYAGNAGVALEPTTGEKTKTINEAIEQLNSGGSTHGSAGIELAYRLAQQHFITGGVNKVILATDGDLNVGVTDDDSLVKLIKQKASEGVFLTVLGFGTGNLQDGKLEKLADNGNGHYAYIDSNREAHRVLVQQLSGSLVTIAKDVKIQVEFNPAEVKSYRLIGYENRMLATKDFADDRKDAGEIGAGHTVTAIYEIEPAGSVAAAFTAPAGMKYQVAGAKVPQQSDEKALLKLSEAASSGELATLALRYKKTDESTSVRIDFAIKNDDKSFTSASDDFRFAASVAGFGMLLRGSEHAGTSTPEMILEMATESTGDDASGYRAEFLDLVRKACR